MTPSPLFSCALLAAALCPGLGAQGLTFENAHSPGGSAAPAAAEAIPVRPPAAASPGADQTALPLPEQRVREGIILLSALNDTMARIQDEETAEAAVAPLMRLHRALQEWTQSFSTLPPLTEQEQQAYEEQYLPIFNKLNNRIRTQGERLAAAEYYGSHDLPAALMHIAVINN